MANQPQRFLNTSSIQLPALILSTFVLAVVLSYTGIQNWRQAHQRFDLEVAQTLDNFAQQSGLLAQAGFHANQVVIDKYQDLIAQAIANPALHNELNRALDTAIFNLTGFMILDARGNVLIGSSPAINANESRDVWNNIQRSTHSEGVFTLRYNDQGGFYFFSAYESPQGKTNYFVSRRSYSDLSSIIFQGRFSGFEMLLLDNRDQSVSIRRHHYINNAEQPQLSAEERERLLYQINVPLTHWDILALSEGQQNSPWYFLKTALMVLVTFFTLNLLLWLLLHYQRKKIMFFRQQHHDSELFASQVLNTIQDVLITSENGKITFANFKALNLLKNLGHTDFLEHPISELLPFSNALWNQDLSDAELKLSSYQHHELRVNSQQGSFTYQQSCTLLKRDSNATTYIWLLHDISDEVLHKESALKNQQRYKALFDEAGVGHCLLDISQIDHGHLRLLDTNPTALAMAEADDQEQLANSIDVLTQGTASIFRKTVNNILAAGHTRAQFALPITTFQQNKKHLLVSISLNPEDRSQLLASFIDNTEQVIAHQQLKEREVFWSNVMQSLPSVVYVVTLNDAELEVQYYNHSIGRLLGYQPIPESGFSWLQYVDERDKSRIDKAMVDAVKMRNGDIREVTLRFIDANQSIRIIKFHNTPFQFDSDGNVSHVIGSARDITEEFEQQERIFESERRYRLLAENISDIIWAADINLNFNFVSSSVERIIGYRPEELLNGNLDLIFNRREIFNLNQHLKDNLRQLKADNQANHLHHQVIIRKDVYATRKDGSTVLLEIQASPFWSDASDLLGVIGTCRDVTDARELEGELQLAAEVFANTNEAIIITDKHLNIKRFNPAFTFITGYTPKQLLGKKPRFLISPEQYKIDFLNTIKDTLETEGYWQGELNYIRADGQERTAWAGISSTLDSNKSMQSLIVILSDITERKSIEESIHKLAYYDALTGLANRSQLNTHLNQLLDICDQKQQSFALLFIDLDRFKPINDSMGHPAGDLVLQKVSQRLAASVKGKDLVCRMGGDEFTIALAPENDHEHASAAAIQVAQRILNKLTQPYSLNGSELYLTGSIGIALYPQDAKNATELLKNADMAMYYAKDLGRNDVQFYNADMNRKAVELLELESDLRHALERQELVLYYQSQHSALTGVVVAAEALLRWQHPRKGLLAPSQFVPIMEDSGLIISIGQWVIEQACLQFSRWQKEGLAMQRIAVNVSARQFHQQNFTQVVENSIKQAGILPSQLEIELTESILIHDLKLTLSILNNLREMGVRIAIDDFGTGYSSLNYLKQFPVETLKIDRTFVQNLPNNKDDAQITRTIIAMAHNLSMGVIAEGVETTEQLEFLRSTGCEEIQGFLFSQPMPADKLSVHLQIK